MEPIRYRIIIVPSAAAEIHAAYEYIHADSPQNAASVVERIIDAIDSLEMFPKRCNTFRSHRDATLVVKSLPVPPYVIYFRVLEKECVVRILTIRHGARRPPRRFRR